MARHQDEFGNLWEGVYNAYQLRNFANKNTIYVWFPGIPGCTWETPHIKHIITIKDLLTNHRHITNNIWVLEKKKGWSTQIWIAIIGAAALIITAIIQSLSSSDKKTIIPSVQQQEVKGNKNIVVQGNQNTVLVNHNKDWEWEDLKSIKNGDTLEVRVVYKIITDQFRWKFGSHEDLDNGTKVSESLPKYLYSLPDFKNAIGIISVGMASEEGNREAEKDRADRRADNILLAINPNKIAVNKSIYKLNLGQHKRTDGQKGDETSYQRKIIIIGVMKWSGNMQISRMETCLKDALKNSEGLSFQTNSYSDFDLTTYRIDYQKKTYKN